MVHGPGVRFMVSSSGFELVEQHPVLLFRDYGFGFRILELRVLGEGCQVQGSQIMVHGSGLKKTP